MRELHTERNYWKKFYRAFTDYLYNEIKCFDNYAGSNVKNIRVFFNYLNKDLGLGIGEFHKLFYVRRESTPVLTLLPEELNFLISNKEFEASLSPFLQKAKDVFVFGCTVALRVSDLVGLSMANLRQANGQYYLVVRSVKTATDTLIKLPGYAVAIISKYSKSGSPKLLPLFTESSLNDAIKALLAKAGFDYRVAKKRERRGKLIEILPAHGSANNCFRFCDLASTHLMRRTAITTMLSLGMPESIVKKISGHAPGSKDFYRYVNWAQAYMDSETDKAFEKLQRKN